jgi:hypothetical protein
MAQCLEKISLDLVPFFGKGGWVFETWKLMEVQAREPLLVAGFVAEVQLRRNTDGVKDFQARKKGRNG